MGRVNDLMIECDEEAYEILKQKTADEPKDEDVRDLSKWLMDEKLEKLKEAAAFRPSLR